MIRTVTIGEELRVELPQVPGIEGVGRITALGDRVRGLEPGQRVYLPLQCGSWREVIHVDAAGLWPAPEGDAVQLSSIVNALTADVALRDLAPLEQGDWFVQNSANSNVGRVLIVLAKRRGYRTVNIVPRESLVDELSALGGDVVLVDGPDLAARVREATGGAPLPIGLDGIGGADTGRLAECLSDRGTVANIGLMSGELCQMPNWVLHYKQISLRGFYAGYHIFERSAEQRREMVGELAELISQGIVHARIAATYPLAEFREAVLHAARSGAERDGKIVFDLSR